MIPFPIIFLRALRWLLGVKATINRDEAVALARRCCEKQAEAYDVVERLRIYLVILVESAGGRIRRFVVCMETGDVRETTSNR